MNGVNHNGVAQNGKRMCSPTGPAHPSLICKPYSVFMHINYIIYIYGFMVVKRAVWFGLIEDQTATEPNRPKITKMKPNQNI